MAQITPNKMQLKRFVGMNGTTWTAVCVPATMGRCHRVVLRNVSGAAISVCTDTADTDAIDSVANAADFEVKLPSRFAGYGPGQQVFFIKGAGGTQPLIYFYE